VIGGVLVEVFLGQFYSLKCIVINIHAALGEVCCVEVAPAINEGGGQARVAGPVSGFDHGDSKRRSRSWIPSSNRPINRGEEE